MDNSHDPRFLKQERDKTDSSLISEREKTNKSLIESRKSTELHTEKIVQDERNKADSVVSEARLAADQQKKDMEHLLSSEDHLLIEDRLLDERKRADDAVELERSKVDIAIIHERETKKAQANLLLDQERKKTDKNLSIERNRTDSEVQHRTGLLHSEISDHEKTKVELTTRDEFMAIVSHDLRNPIGAASMCAEMLLQDPNKNLSTEVIKSLELIKRNVDTSLRLIADILDMERIEEGKLQLKLERHRIDQIISECIENFTPMAIKKRITLQANPCQVSSDVICDHDRIHQVLSNLIGNALKFTPNEGSVTIAALFNETVVQVSICDTGPGVPENKKNQIFKRFAQLGQNDRLGLGLGLYISKMLIEEHRGMLWVESQLDKGSTFYFTLPVERPTI